MAAQNRTGLHNAIAQSLGDNTIGNITPTILRGQMDALVDSTFNKVDDVFGNSSTRDVGTTAGTVAAGDDARFSAFAAVREVLTADRTYYVRADGNNANNGLANTAGGAWATLQFAYDYIAQGIDLRGYNATVQIGPGTYSGLTVFGPVGSGPTSAGTGIKFVGDTTTPSNVVITSTAGGQCVLCTYKGIVIISGVKFVSASGDGLYASGGGIISIPGKVEFGACSGYHMHANANGTIVVSAGSYTISGGAQAHYNAEKVSLIEVSTPAVTLTGTPAFTWFAVAKMGYLIHGGCTFTGSATGQKYVSFYNGVLDSGGAAAGVNYFPGSTAGLTSNGGQYI